jgi:Uncharacterised nucleotidyltransferase
MAGKERPEPFREIMRETTTPATVLSMAPEDQLCLLLARGQVSPEVRSRILQFLAAPLQWPLILERARTHQVYPLLYRNLRDLGFSGVPEAVQAELKGLYLANAFRNQLLAEELARLLRLLGEAGIRVVPLKGVALAQSLYGDVASRVWADIDILVPPANVGQALALLLAFGYRAEPNDPYLSKLALRHGRHFSMVREGKGISFLLEVHWILVQHSSQNDEAVRDLWSEARPQSFFGVPALDLTREWELLYLSIHAADHEWQMLKWLVDIHQLASSGSADWQKAMAKAKRLELDRLIRQTLAVSSFLLGTVVPSSCSPATLPERLQIFPHAPLPEDSPEATLAFRHLRVLRRSLDKLRYFATAVFAPKLTDLEFVRLPPYLGFLYYFIRPLRLACKWGGRALGKNQV